jgi:hypothetical protein
MIMICGERAATYREENQEGGKWAAEESQER